MNDTRRISPVTLYRLMAEQAITVTDAQTRQINRVASAASSYRRHHDRW
jgi:hypothetical protein